MTMTDEEHFAQIAADKAAAAARAREWGQQNAQLTDPWLDRPVSPRFDELTDRLADSIVDFGADFWAADFAAEDFLVAPLLARGRGHSLYAPAKAGKSLLALYLAACAATGRAVLDQPAGPPITVIYCDMEMTRADLRERLEDMGFSADDDLSNLVYYSLPSLSPLDTPHGGADLVAIAQHHQADLVVIDTLSRVIGGEENANDSVQNFAMYTGTPLKAAGITVLRLDHAGKIIEKGQRGGSAKTEDVDVVWQLLPRDRGRFTLRATHRRINWVPEQIELEQTSDPLAYSISTDSWPAGTKATADLLDKLQVPIDVGRDKARKAIKFAGEAVNNDALGAAIRWRRSKGIDVVETIGQDQ